MSFSKWRSLCLIYCIELNRKENQSKKTFKVSYYVLGSQEIRKLSLNVQLCLCLCRHYDSVNWDWYSTEKAWSTGLCYIFSLKCLIIYHVLICTVLFTLHHLRVNTTKQKKASTNVLEIVAAFFCKFYLDNEWGWNKTFLHLSHATYSLLALAQLFSFSKCNST